MITSLDSQPLVSVILPAFNAEKYIRAAVDSILNQTYKNFELIIIDDCSVDNTREIIKSYDDSRVKLLLNSENLGITKTLNYGIKEAQGKYLARMDSDDVCHPDRFEKQVSFLEENNDVDVLGTNIFFIDPSSAIQGKSYPLPSTPNICKFLLARTCVIAHPSVMIRAEIVGDSDLYSSNFPHAEDYELWLRLTKNRKVTNLPDYLLYYRVHPESITQQNYNSATNEMLSALIHHNPMNFNGDNKVELIKFIRKPQLISTYQEQKIAMEAWTNSLNKFMRTNKLNSSEYIELFKAHYTFLGLSVLYRLKAQKRINLSLILKHSSIHIFKFRVWKRIIEESFFIINRKLASKIKFFRSQKLKKN